MSRAAKKSEMPCIVVFDDSDKGGMIVPFAWDPDCAGAICCFGRGEPVAMFDDRPAARKAIRVSVAFAKLQIAQGKPANTDFTTDLKKVHVVPLAKGPPHE